MIFQSIKNLVTSKDICASLETFAIMKLEGSLIFYHTAIKTGLFQILTKPSTLDTIADKLNIANRQLLSSLLDLGCSLKEIACKNGEYRLKGAMAKALVRNVPLAELIKETVQYHADIALRLDSYLMGNVKGNYLNDFGGVIAESSRLTEPLIKAFIFYTIKKLKPLTILEFGCGAGEYLKYYVDINKNNRGIAVDIDASAVAIARSKVIEHKIERNFSVLHGNILKQETLKDGSFDVVTSYSNMHYFSVDDRMHLFTKIHKLLKNNGRFMLATAFKSKTLSSSYYDLIFSATQGLYPLPDINEIINDLKKSGFSRVKTVNLLNDTFKGLVAFS